jgi:hypothetical protein
LSEFKIFVYISLGLGIIVFVMAIAALVARYLLGPEGMHFLTGKLTALTDMARYEPLTNRLILDRVKWDGTQFLGRMGIYHPLRAILNPDSESKKFYNQAISTSARWAGNGKPVVFTTDLLSFALSSEFFAKLKASKNPLPEDVVTFVSSLETVFEENEIEYFSFFDTFTLSDVQDVMVGETPARMQEQYEKGIRRERIKNDKLKQPFKLGLPWIILAVVVVLAAAFYVQRMIGSGQL